MIIPLAEFLERTIQLSFSISNIDTLASERDFKSSLAIIRRSGRMFQSPVPSLDASRNSPNTRRGI